MRTAPRRLLVLLAPLFAALSSLACPPSAPPHPPVTPALELRFIPVVEPGGPDGLDEAEVRTRAADILERKERRAYELGSERYDALRSTTSASQPGPFLVDDADDFDALGHLVDARAATDALGLPCLVLEFDAAGAKRLHGYSRAHIGRKIAIVLDGVVLSAPRITAELGEAAVVAGSFSKRRSAASSPRSRARSRRARGEHGSRRSREAHVRKQYQTQSTAAWTSAAAMSEPARR